MPRVCAHGAPLLVVLIAGAVGGSPAAHATNLPGHMGLYVAKSGGKTAGTAEKPDELPAVASTIAATATGPLIEVVTTQRFTNTSKHTIEAVYVFPLPPDAAVTAMSIKVGDEVIHAEVVARDQAVTQHEAAVAAGVLGALFEQDRPDVFTQTITGIAAGATVEIELRWDTVATRRDGGWELVVPLVVAPRAAPGTATGQGVVGSGTSPDTDRSPDASRVTPPTHDDGGGTETAFTLALDAKANNVTSPSHELVVKTTSSGTTVSTTDPTSARDLIVRWKTRGKPRGWIERDDTEGFVAVTVEAPVAKKSKAHAIRVVIAVDDGGRAGESVVIGRHVERALIGALGRKDKFAARGKSGAYDWHGGGKVTADGAASAAARHDLVAELGRLADVIDASDGLPDIVLVTDGLVADQAAAVSAAQQLLVPVHVIGVGAAPNRSLVLAIAAATGGTARFVDTDGTDDADATAALVVADLAHPATAPVIDWNGLEVVDVHPATLPRLGAGQAITVTARTTKPRAAKIKVDRSGAFAIEVDARPAAPEGATSPHGLIARVWARTQLGELIDTGASAADVSRVALTYGLVSPYTAMIAVGEKVVDSSGTTYSMAVPVAVPSGMRWQAKFDDEIDGRTTTAPHRPAKKTDTQSEDLGKSNTTATGSPTPTGGVTKEEPSVDHEGARDEDKDSKSAEQRLESGNDDDAGGGDGDASESPQNAPEPTSVGGDYYRSGSGGEALDMAMETSASARYRRGFALSLRAVGGLVLSEGERHGMGAVSGRFGMALGRAEAGVDLSLWVVGADRDIVGRVLLSTSFTGLFGGWLDLSLGAGGHFASESGVGYAAGLRFGPSKLTPTLRWDGAVVRGEDGHLHASGAVNAGLEIDF